MSEKKLEGIELQHYQRTFSDLGEFQKAHSITYRLYQQENECVFAIECKGKRVQTTRIVARLAKEQAMQLMTLLYENAVSIELCEDVLAQYDVQLVS